MAPGSSRRVYRCNTLLGGCLSYGISMGSSPGLRCVGDRVPGKAASDYGSFGTRQTEKERRERVGREEEKVLKKREWNDNDVR